jgi:Fe-S-cluster containining protein
MSEWKCKQCGFCCIPYVINLEENGNEKHIDFYKKRKVKGKDTSLYLSRKWEFITDLKIKLLVCFYYDEKNKKCSIYEKRPIACREYKCSDKIHNSFLRSQRKYYKYLYSFRKYKKIRKQEEKR